MSGENTEKKIYVRPTIRRQFMGHANKFGGLAIPEPVVSIDGVAVADLVREFGSPLFVFSEATLRRKVRELNHAFSSRYPRFQAAWSYKTNYLDAICRVFHDEGSWAEVVSGFEYKKARANGIPGNRILFNGPYKPLPVLREAIESGTRIHVDHLDELSDCLTIARELGRPVSVTLRINMDTGTWPSWDRFGFNLESGQALEAVRRIAASDGKLRLTGLHAHIGTFMMDSAPYKRAAAKLAQFWKKIVSEYAQPLEYLDLGGGFASANRLKGQYLSGSVMLPSFDQYAEAITSALYEGFEPAEPPQLFLETGRALVDDAGFLVTSVVANKTTPDGKRALVIDAGVNILFTAYWYDITAAPSTRHAGSWEEVALFGPLCMNIDKVRESCLLPSLQRGEQIVLHPVGAYNVTQWLQFIEMRPNVVMIDRDGKPKIIRHAESLDDIVGREEV